MKNKQVSLEDLIDVSKPAEVIREVAHTIRLAKDEFDPAFIQKIYVDICKLFNGDYPGYFASTNKYHDLDHTNSVFLASARLIHACTIEGTDFSSENINAGLAAALFHDTGFIKTLDDPEGTGAKYTDGHEIRSILFMEQYFKTHGFSMAIFKKSIPMIKCTILKLKPSEITFPSRQIEMLGKIIGATDLLAQMADRLYLEKLILLFEEFEEADIPGFDTPLDLLKKTIGFFEDTAHKRLVNDFNNIGSCMDAHFKYRWDIDQDLYENTILNSIAYLKRVINDCQGDFSCYLNHLRRGDLYF